MKRYVAEPGSDLVREATARADVWLMCRAGYIETMRALATAAGPAVGRIFRREWPAFGIVEVDQGLVEDAASLAVTHGLRSLDALHLAAALLLPPDDLVFATWDHRLHAAAQAESLALLPETVH